MSPLNTSDLYRIFESLDRNNDGLLSLDELNWLLESTGSRGSNTLHELVDLFGKTSLNFEEFSIFHKFVFMDIRIGDESDDSKRNASTYKFDIIEDREEDDEEEEESDLYKAFKVFDLNGDGFISSKELQSVLCNLGTWDKNCSLNCDKIIQKYDVNSDGFVDFNEFKIMMLAHH